MCGEGEEPWGEGGEGRERVEGREGGRIEAMQTMIGATRKHDHIYAVQLRQCMQKTRMSTNIYTGAYSIKEHCS